MHHGPKHLFGNCLTQNADPSPNAEHGDEIGIAELYMCVCKGCGIVQAQADIKRYNPSIFLSLHK